MLIHALSLSSLCFFTSICLWLFVCCAESFWLAVSSVIQVRYGMPADFYRVWMHTWVRIFSVCHPPIFLFSSIYKLVDDSCSIFFLVVFSVTYSLVLQELSADCTSWSRVTCILRRCEVFDTMALFLGTLLRVAVSRLLLSYLEVMLRSFSMANASCKSRFYCLILLLHLYVFQSQGFSRILDFEVVYLAIVRWQALWKGLFSLCNVL